MLSPLGALHFLRGAVGIVNAARAVGAINLARTVGVVNAAPTVMN